MKLFAAGLFLFTSAAFAASIAPVSYHDATLVSLTAPPSAGHCAELGCDDTLTQYMVESEGVMYALTPANNGSLVERASFGWNKAIGKTSTLYHLPPGTPLQMRDDGRHIFVRVGNRGVELHRARDTIG